MERRATSPRRILARRPFLPWTWPGGVLPVLCAALLASVSGTAHADPAPAEAASEPLAAEPASAAPAVAEPAIVAPPAANAEPPPAAPVAKPDEAPAASAPADELAEPGYLPGYRSTLSLGMSPFTPAVGALPGGITPSFMAPTPTGRWTLRWWGYLSASAQFGMNERLQTQSGAHELVFHAPPATIEDYGSFTSVSAVPGHWVQMYFSYGSRDVSAVVMLATWNPTESTTYYQLGSEHFIHSAYLSYRLPPLGPSLVLSAKAGYFYDQYGQLGQYDLGMYQNPIAAIVRGVGGTLTATLTLSPRLGLVIEEGVLGNRNGRAPSNLTRQNPNYNTDPFFPGSYVQHAHVGLVYRGSATTLKAQLHHIYNWAQDDRPEVATDNMVTRAIDESYIRDGRMHVFAAELAVSHPGYGYFALAASRLVASHAYTLRGVTTFGGEGANLTDRWLGDETYGSGTVDVLAVNYTVHLLQALRYPTPHDRADLVLTGGGVLATSHNPTSADSPKNPVMDGRVRYKGGLDLLAILASWVGVACRVDYVVPNHRDAAETFWVLAPRLVLKTHWQSRETVSLRYAKWFYGSRSHAEASAAVPPRLDDQLISLNVNMWW